MNNSSDIFGEKGQTAGQSIDFRRVLSHALKFWYLVILSVAIAFTIAYFKNRYAVRIYPVSATIVIRESQESSEGKLLYNNPLVANYRNYFNELYLIQSYPMIQSVIEELNFGVSFFQEGNFMTTEAYDYIPVDAFVINDNGQHSTKLITRILDESQFQLELNGEVSDKQTKTFNFNDTLTYGGLKMIFRVKPDKNIRRFKGQSFIFLYSQPASITGSYVGRLNAEWVEQGAGIIELSISGPNPNKEKDFLNGLIRRYQAYDLERKNQTASRAIDFIKNQLTSISDSLQNVEVQLQRFKDKNVVTDLTGETLRLYQKIEQLELQKTDLVLRENYFDYLTEYFKRGNNLDLVILPSSVGISDGILTEQLSKIINIQTEMKLYLNREKSGNPLVTNQQNRLNELKGNILELINNQRSTEKIKLDYINKQVHSVEKQLGYLPMAEKQLVAIQRNYSLLENLYVYLMQKMAEVGISKASSSTDISSVNAAMAGGPVSPKPAQNYMMAILLGLFFPIAAFFIVEIFNTKVQSKEDIEKISNIPFIGGVGHKKSDDNKVVLAHPKSAVAESFRALRSNLNYFVGGKEKSLFIITSSISGEGKTFTTVNLATVLALSGKKTLIVGADLRKPKLFFDFNLNNDSGLSSFLANMNPFDEIVQRTYTENLDLISAGPVPPNPSELLLGSKMEEFIKECLKRYDYVIMDTPPLAIVTDAFVLSKYADHIVFVVRQNYTPKALLKTVQEYYESNRISKISLLLNDIYKSGPGYGYGYGYGYSYGYGYGYGYGNNGHGYYEETTTKS